MDASVLRKTLTGTVWSMASGWVQLAVSALTFTVVARWLKPEDLGAFGVFTLATSFATLLCSIPFCDGVQQRKTLEPDHLHASFWLTLCLSLLAAATLSVFAHPFAHMFSAPAAEAFLPWAFLALPVSATANFASAILSRELRFACLSKLGAAASLVTGVTVMAALASGLGAVSLLVGGLTGQIVFACCATIAARYRPRWPSRFAAIHDLTRFNAQSLVLNLLGFADGATPRVVAGLALGPAGLGYYMAAERILQLMTSLVMSPLAGMTMTSVARLQDDRPELRRLVKSLYRLASLIAYPAFVGLILLLPDLMPILGERWLATTLATQLLLLTALRTATGMFNVSILRGLGHGRGPLLLLGAGLALVLCLAPIGAMAAGATGIACAVLARTYLTWPLGCWLIRRATGLPISEQLKTGSTGLLATSGMAAAVLLFLSTAQHLAPAERLLGGTALGIASYTGLLMILLAPMAPLRSLLRGDRATALLWLRHQISA